MSILSALKTQQGSLRELAMLPQQQILQMAQLGQLDVSMVPVILNEKAQMAQQVANAQAMAQGTPPSIVEQAMAINAQADAQAEAEAPPAGLEALPVPENMYTEQGMAAGGIVAFEGGGSVQHFQNQGSVSLSNQQVDPRVLRSYYLSRGMELPDELLTPEELKKKRFLQSTQQEYPAGAIPSFGRFLSDMGTRVEGALTDYGGFGYYDTPKAAPTATQAAAPTAAPAPATTPGDLKRLEKQQGSAYMNGPAETPPIVPARKGTARTEAPAEAQASAEDPYARYKRMLKEAGVSDDPFAEDRAANAAAKAQLGSAREDAKNMALLEAGLSIMGGTSPYALQNLAQAKGAVGSYAKSMREIKADEREYTKIDRDLRKAEQALKRGDVDKAFELQEKAEDRKLKLRQVAASEAAAARTPGEIQLIERYAKDRGITFSQAFKEIGGIKAEPKSRDAAAKEWANDPLIRRQYPNFEDYYASTRGGGGTAGWGDVRVKQP